MNCGLAQKPVDEQWSDEMNRLYSGYRMYHQAKNEDEQRVASGDGFLMRSDAVFSWLSRFASLPYNGRLLDFGCGNGAALGGAYRTFPAWDLFGLEPNIANPDRLHALPGVRDIVGDLNDLEGSFDVVSLMHVLEHVPAPIDCLKSITPLLSDDGCILIQVPYYLENPYELCVADHNSHFTVSTLSDVVERAGLSVAHSSVSVLKREVTVLATLGTSSSKQTPSSQHSINVDVEHNNLTACVEWLRGIVETLDQTSSTQIGVFGTSIAATWLASHLGDRVAFFVDEDESRVGQSFMGKITYRPQDVPKGSTVFLTLSAEVASIIEERYRGLGLEWILPKNADWL